MHRRQAGSLAQQCAWWVRAMVQELERMKAQANEDDDIRTLEPHEKQQDGMLTPSRSGPPITAIEHTSNRSRWKALSVWKVWWAL